ncbi:PTS sugar transporter subunit IIA [Agarilytica rhodophyticola]|uniref:PTS sugar transporter subunit IIA n=1 Tax=Agarilytica rhodophyticola TaxID=1737490 RepID=UPI000B3466DB|nr:PTS sugar transporter subunit IIA [Agarilytica rhodophyticola]
MLIKSILSTKRTVAKIEGGSKKRVIETLAQNFANDIEGFDVDELYQSLINREKLGTTGIGDGIAIPHCRFNTGGHTYGACMTLASPIDFDAVDGKPVDIIFAMLVPENAESSHLESLASLAQLLQDADFVSTIRSVSSDDALFDAITSSS